MSCRVAKFRHPKMLAFDLADDNEVYARLAAFLETIGNPEPEAREGMTTERKTK